MQRHCKDRTLWFLCVPEPFEEYNVWDEALRDLQNNYLYVDYMSCVQLHPNFQRAFGNLRMQIGAYAPTIGT